MKIITETPALQAACETIKNYKFCTVDTEFLRESTFWPKLCLIQMACDDDEWIIDTLAQGIDLVPFYELMADTSIVKVFHAARQDVEIIHHQGGIIPEPMFDTQVAAMVCGFGDSISYDQLVKKLTGTQLDKSSRFTNWSKRPLSSHQLNYAMADVTHLRDVYKALTQMLEENNRTEWVSEEMRIITSPETYDIQPQDAWKRLKMRARRPVELALLKRLAEWREVLARKKDVPRGRIIKDDGIYDVSARAPTSMKQLNEMRSLSRGFDKNRYGDEVLGLVEEVQAIPKDELPKIPRQKQTPEGSVACTEMLKLLLKLTAEKHGVAAKIIATVDDLEKISADDEADVAAMHGWRKELFGNQALRLKSGELALGYKDKSVQLIETNGAQEG